MQADHERLIITYSISDYTVYVLTPPGEDPRAVLRAARLVVPEDTYEDLADHLGVPSGWQRESPGGATRRPDQPPGGGCHGGRGCHGASCSIGGRSLARRRDRPEPARDFTRLRVTKHPFSYDVR